MLKYSKKSIVIFLCIFAGSLTVAFSVFAREVDVSTRTLVLAGNQDITGSKTIDFSISGGEVVGASGTMKVYLSIDGLYQGGGSFVVRIDGDPLSDQTFTLPNVPDSATFSFIYIDRAHKLAATTAGTYMHTLTLLANGVSLSTVSVHATNSYTREIGNNCPDGLPSTEKTKTVEYFISGVPAITSMMTLPISYAINDDISAISGAVTSAYVELSGHYDGAGTVSLYFNDPLRDGVTYALPATPNPAKFDLLSVNAKDVFQHATGGAYTQQFTIDPKGITLSSVSMKLVLSYVFHPAQSGCGGFPATGEAESAVLDTGATGDVLYNSLTWRGVLGGANGNVGKVRFQFASASCANGASDYPTCSVGGWNYVGGATCSSGDWFTTLGPDIPFDLFRSGCVAAVNGKEYYRYKVQLCADDCVNQGVSTPVVDQVFVSWSP